MNKIKEKINKIYRASASLNLYSSICNPTKDRIKKELLSIKDMIDELLKKLN